MAGKGNLFVRSDGAGARQALTELVMAWARDSDTGEPRYILELGADRRGAKCGCECPSCGLPLTAVNAAKAEFVRRPHFRHPEGAERDECLVLAARAAALRQLQDDGWFQLPRRRMSAKVAGLSGEFYEAWVEQPAEKLHIRQVDYRDRAVAIITFDDGRQLHVELTGTPGDVGGEVDAGGLPVPTILLDVSDPSLAAMAPDELRQRMTLLPNGICWRGHWDDADLLARAMAAARAKAQFYFDELPDGLELPEGLDATLRRETVLHYEVKRILAEGCRLAVPGLEVRVEVAAPGGRTLRGRWAVAPDMLKLDYVDLEQRLGRLIPDITCKAWPVDGGRVHWPLLIEVTVTNPIDDERLGRIRDMGAAALEIDLSLAGGRVTRDELRRLVVDELATKRWLHHPELEEQRAALLSGLAKQAEEELAALEARTRLAEERRQRVLATPVADVAREYLDAVIALLDAGADTDSDGVQMPLAKAAEAAARERVADAADKLALHGHPEAADENLIGPHGILARTISIRLDRPVGYRLENVMGVLNAIKQDSGIQRSNHTLFFIAVSVYKPTLTERQQAWFDKWAAAVKASIRDEERTYLRDPAYDNVLALLFPEMAAALAKPGGKRAPSDTVSWDAQERVFRRHELPERRRATFIERQPSTLSAGGRLQDTRPGDWWLKGRDLEAWKKANPEYAKAWFGVHVVELSEHQRREPQT